MAPSGGWSRRRFAPLIILFLTATSADLMSESRCHEKPGRRRKSTAPAPSTQSRATADVNRTWGGCEGYSGVQITVSDKMRPSNLVCGPRDQGEQGRAGVSDEGPWGGRWQRDGTG